MSVVGVEGSFDVAGAQRAVAHFATLDERRLAHGYLFSGPNGVGKKTFARALAQSLLCERPKSTLLGYCNECRNCTLFRAGSHPDYHEVVGPMGIRRTNTTLDEETTSVDIIQAMSLRPYLARWRVAMLGDVAFKSEDAANALLKLLEEPSPNVLFLLTSDARARLLATVRSRMIEIAFDPLARDEVAGVLTRDGVPPERAQAAAAGAQGSITRARTLLGGAEGGLRDAAIDWFCAAVSGRVPDQSLLRLDDKTASAAERRELIAGLLEVVATVARDWAAVTVVGAGAPLLASDARERLASLPPRSPREALRIMGAAGRAVALASSGVVNVRAALVLDDLRMELA